MEKIVTKLQRDDKYFYIKYNDFPEWEKIRIMELPMSVRALLTTFCSAEYECVVEAEKYF